MRICRTAISEYRIVRDDGSVDYRSVSGEPNFDAGGKCVGYRGIGRSITARKLAEDALLRKNAELSELNAKLSQAQAQLLQAEKLASIGQLAAGVAHEINNPIGYIFSNFQRLEEYLKDLFAMLSAYQAAESTQGSPETAAELAALRERVELDYLKEDIPMLMAESKEGIARVRRIVQGLKDFSRVDGYQDWQRVDLHRCIDSTLNIANNEIKYKADVVREYGPIPEVECMPSQINQVILNLLVNAAHAIGEKRGRITIRTGSDEEHVWFAVTDTGRGIAKEIQSRIFDPFFTTKPVGEGTGLGLSLCYGIVQEHLGRIDVESEPGRGTTFRVTLPIERPMAEGATMPSADIEPA